MTSLTLLKKARTYIAWALSWTSTEQVAAMTFEGGWFETEQEAADLWGKLRRHVLLRYQRRSGPRMRGIVDVWV